MRSLIDTQKKIINKELLKLKPKIGDKILILKDVNPIPNYVITEAEL